MAVDLGWENGDDEIVSVNVEGTSYDPRLGSILDFLAKKLPEKRHFNLDDGVNIDVYTPHDMIQYIIVQGNGTKEETGEEAIVLGVL
jgi:hypothetical protein